MSEFKVKVTMVKPYFDSFIRKPSVADALDALATMILEGLVDDYFVVEIREKMREVKQT